MENLSLFQNSLVTNIIKLTIDVEKEEESLFSIIILYMEENNVLVFSYTEKSKYIYIEI